MPTLFLSSPHIGARWSVFGSCLSVYFLRVYWLGQFFIVTYGLGIYLLNQLIGFISPQFDPDAAGTLLLVDVCM